MLVVLGVIAGVLVGLSFVAAGLFKLADGPAWPQQAADMGVARPIAVVVPYVEIAIGGLLIVPIVRPWPAVAAVALLVVFTTLILVRIADGSRPPCACFGSRSKRPLGAFHVVRNLGLLVLAGLAVALA